MSLVCRFVASHDNACVPIDVVHMEADYVAISKIILSQSGSTKELGLEAEDELAHPRG